MYGARTLWKHKTQPTGEVKHKKIQYTQKYFTVFRLQILTLQIL